MPERYLPRTQAADLFAQIDKTREERRIPSRFSETAEKLRRQQTGKTPPRKVIGVGKPIKSRFSSMDTPGSYDSSGAAPRPQTKPGRRENRSFPQLTPAQAEIAELIVLGLKTSQISEQLNRSIEAIKTSRSNMAKRLGIETKLLTETLTNLRNQKQQSN